MTTTDEPGRFATCSFVSSPIQISSRGLPPGAHLCVLSPHSPFLARGFRAPPTTSAPTLHHRLLPFATASRPSGSPNAGPPVTPDDILKMMALRFLQLKNAQNFTELERLCAVDVVLYGTRGSSAGIRALRQFFLDHPGLTHSTRSHADFEVVGRFVVQYGFEKKWRDKSSGEERTWDGFEKGKVERLHFAPTGHLKKVEVVGRFDPVDATERGKSSNAVGA